MEAQTFIEIECINQEEYYFVYKNKKYPIDFESFKIGSNYFRLHKKEFRQKKMIPLIDEDFNYDIPEEAIYQFIKYVEHQKIPVNRENVIYLTYLGHKYEIPSLIESTNKFIDEHEQKLTLEILCAHQNEGEFSTSKYEKRISQHLNEYMNDSKIFELNFLIFYPIISEYQRKEKEESITKIRDEEMNENLFKSLSKYGEEASVLFEKVDMTKFGQANFCRLLTEYSKKFDFHYINPNFMKTLYDTQNELFCNQKEQEIRMMKMIEEMSNQINELRTAFLEEGKKKEKKEEEMSKEINELKTTFSEEGKKNKKKEEEMSKEINELKRTFSEEGKKNKKKEEEMSKEIQNLRKEIEELKTVNSRIEIENKIIENLKDIEDKKEKQEKELKQLKKLIEETRSSMSLSTESSKEEFNKLDGETQITVININKSITGNNHSENITNLLTYLSNKIHQHQTAATTLNKKMKYIYIQHEIKMNSKNEEEDYNKNFGIIGISSDMTEFHFNNDQPETDEMNKYASNFCEFYIELKYPTDNFEELYEKIVKFKNMNQTKIKICILIRGIAKTNLKFYNNEN